MHIVGLLALAVVLATAGFALGDLADRVSGRRRRGPIRRLEAVATADRVWINDCDRPFHVVTAGPESVVVEAADGQQYRLAVDDDGALVLVRTAARYPDGGVRVRRLRTE